MPDRAGGLRARRVLYVDKTYTYFSDAMVHARGHAPMSSDTIFDVQNTCTVN